MTKYCFYCSNFAKKHFCCLSHCSLDVVNNRRNYRTLNMLALRFILFKFILKDNPSVVLVLIIIVSLCFYCQQKERDSYVVPCYVDLYGFITVTYFLSINPLSIDYPLQEQKSDQFYSCTLALYF